MLDNGKGYQFADSIEQIIVNQKFNYERNEVDNHVRIRVPAISKRSTMEGFVLYISDYTVQVYAFDVVKDVDKNEKYLNVLNDVNLKTNFWKFTINEHNSVVGYQEYFIEFLDGLFLIEFLIGAIDTMEDVFDDFMRARYS